MGATIHITTPGTAKGCVDLHSSQIEKRKQEEGGRDRDYDHRNRDKEVEPPSLELCVVLDHRPALQETGQVVFQQHRKGCREQGDDATRVEDCNGRATPTRVTFLDTRNDHDGGSRAWFERADDCVKEGCRSTVRVRFEVGITGDGKGHAFDEESTRLTSDPSQMS